MDLPIKNSDFLYVAILNYQRVPQIAGICHQCPITVSEHLRFCSRESPAQVQGGVGSTIFQALTRPTQELSQNGGYLQKKMVIFIENLFFPTVGFCWFSQWLHGTCSFSHHFHCIFRHLFHIFHWILPFLSKKRTPKTPLQKRLRRQVRNHQVTEAVAAKPLFIDGELRGINTTQCIGDRHNSGLWTLLKRRILIYFTCSCDKGDKLQGHEENDLGHFFWLLMNGNTNGTSVTWPHIPTRKLIYRPWDYHFSVETSLLAPICQGLC